MPDASQLAPLLATGQYDKYMQELIDSTYGHGSVSPYLRRSLTGNAEQMALQAQMQAIVDAQDPDMNTITDPAIIAQALQNGMAGAFAGNGTGLMQGRAAQDSGQKFLAKLAQMSQQGTDTPGGMLAEVLYNDPAMIQKLMMATIPTGMGGIFGPGMKKQMQEKIGDSIYEPVQSGNYFNDLNQMMARFTGNAEPMSGFQPPSAATPSPLVTDVINSISATPEEKAALIAELEALGQ
jgi:hypothetical protein